jgi:hypothetical protein
MPKRDGDGGKSDVARRAFRKSIKLARLAMNQTRRAIFGVARVINGSAVLLGLASGDMWAAHGDANTGRLRARERGLSDKRQDDQNDRRS